MQCGNLLHRGGMWALSLALNRPNAAGVYVAGSEPVPGLSLCETGLCCWISWLGRLLIASFCIKGVTCIWFNCKATLLGVWPDWAQLPAGAGKGWFWCWDCPWPKEQDAGRAQWKAVAVSRIQPVFSLWHYSLSGKWLSSLYLILELHSLTPSAITFKGTDMVRCQGAYHQPWGEGILPPGAVHKSTLGCELEE